MKAVVSETSYTYAEIYDALAHASEASVLSLAQRQVLGAMADSLEVERFVERQQPRAPLAPLAPEAPRKRDYRPRPTLKRKRKAS